MARFRITYNAPVVLTFTFAAVVAYLLPDSLHEWFASYPSFKYGAHTYVGLFSHILGHGSWEHLLGNFMLILLIGPILEERHGSYSLLAMILITALVTGLINVAVGSHPLLGASGIVFMMILLASTANIKQGEIPLTFVAIAVIYLGGEVYRAVRSDDQVSHMAHLIGGLVGAAFGFLGAHGVGKKAATPGAAPAAKPKALAADAKKIAIPK